MSREVPFDENDTCGICGKAGAFDVMGDLICSGCLNPKPTLFQPDKPGIRKGDEPIRDTRLVLLVSDEEAIALNKTARDCGFSSRSNLIRAALAEFFKNNC